MPVRKPCPFAARAAALLLATVLSAAVLIRPTRAAAAAARPGNAYVRAGCDTCGNRWTRIPG